MFPTACIMLYHGLGHRLVTYVRYKLKVTSFKTKNDVTTHPVCQNGAVIPACS
jgi:hypothetical protein